MKERRSVLKSAIACISAFAVLSTALVSTGIMSNPFKVSAEDSKPIVLEPEENALLGAATHFHIFAEQVTVNTHIHGNIATNMLIPNAKNFGVENDKLNGYESISYFKDFQGTLNEKTIATSTIFGSGFTVDSHNNGNGVIINSPSGGIGTFNDSSYLGTIYYEDSTVPFIDIEAELDKLTALSNEIAEQPDSSGIVITGDHNTLTIDCSAVADEVNYITLEAGVDFTSMTVLHIKGLDIENGGALYVNIDVSGVVDENDKATFEKEWIVYDTDGENIGNGEHELGKAMPVIYNFVKDGKAFEGTIFTPGCYQIGTFFGPSANFDLNSGVNGSIIGRDVIINMETHRYDVQVGNATIGGGETPTDPTDPDEKYTVTFNPKGGSAVNPITDVEEGSTITAPTAPTKPGYDFVGWYKDDNLTNEWNFETDTVSGDTTLYAKWEESTTDPTDPDPTEKEKPTLDVDNITVKDGDSIVIDGTALTATVTK